MLKPRSIADVIAYIVMPGLVGCSILAARAARRFVMTVGIAQEDT